MRENNVLRFSYRTSSLRRSRNKRQELRLRLEQLESRYLLAGQLGYDQVHPEWFESIVDERSAAVDTASDAPSTARGVSKFIGPVRPNINLSQASEWVIRLSEQATESIDGPGDADRLLDNEYVNFEIVRGLGLPGLLLVEGFSAETSLASKSLAGNPFVGSYTANESVQGTIAPNDSDFPGMYGLNNVGQFGGTNDADVDAPEAWDITTGSPSVVVGVIDSGVDATHPDLYLNIWINQGEIRAEIASQLTDIDADGLITFYDLNDAVNSSQVKDLNNNGYIDAIDLLEDPLWADGLDTDHNGFVDDFFGWNFRSNVNEPFAANNPSDVLGHGTHISGTIGAIGNNDLGVTGLNWQTSIMALKFLDQNNSGNLADAIAAINYATMMRSAYDTNVRITNNSWGTPGGFSPALRAAISASGDAGILFVAAAGNGNLLGQGVDNDRTPFYPASYELDNVLAVAASNSHDAFASFTNFGNQSVDVAAPGVGILSTLPGGRYGTANGTSMAAPHVAGAAALISASIPSSTPAEIKAAIAASADPIADGLGRLVSGGRLNAAGALNADVFAPSAVVISAADVTSSGGNSNEITIEYSHRDGIDASSIGHDDLVVTRQWGPTGEIAARLKSGSIVTSGNSVTATYEVFEPDTKSFTNSTSILFGEGTVGTVGPFTFANTTAVPIAATSANTISSQIQVANVPAAVTDFTISLDIDHTWVSDLSATLIGPNGSRATLFANLGGSADDFSGTTFDDNALIPISAGSAPFTGTFQPVQNLASLLAGGANGTWRLEIEDRFSADGGALQGWSLNFPEVTGSSIDSTITSEISVAGVTGAYDEFIVSVDIAHTSIGDLTATLISPDGTRAVLFSGIGGSQDNLTGTSFLDTAATSISTALYPFQGTYRPQNNIAPLAAAGQNGIWTLELEDGVDNGESGELLNWSIDLAGSWDPLDFGEYVIATRDSAIQSSTGISNVAANVGDFEVRIVTPDIFYVDSVADENDANPGDGRSETPSGVSTLRSAIQEANTRSAASLIILNAGNYALNIAGTDEDFAVVGDLDLTADVTIIGDSAGSTRIDGQKIDRVFDVQPGGSLSLDRLGIYQGAVDGGGGAIRSRGTLEIKNSRIADNVARAVNSNIAGGGILVEAGTALIKQSEIIDNATVQSINDIGYGGGLAVTNGAATVESTTIAFNKSQRGGGAFSFGDLMMTNTTVSNNETFIRQLLSQNPCFCNGSAIFVAGTGTFELKHATVLNNRSLAANAGGIAFTKSAGQSGSMTALVENSIIAGNGFDLIGLQISDFDPTVTWLDWPALQPISFGPTFIATSNVTSSRTNVISSLFTGDNHFFLDIIDPDAATSVFPLDDNGGLGLTHALRQGSPAIDAASATSLQVDQRGVSRPRDGNGDQIATADVGAYESATGTISGVLFQDRDHDGRLDSNDVGLANRSVFLDLDLDGVRDSNEPLVRSENDDLATGSTLETGRFRFDHVLPGTYLVSQLPPDGWVPTAIVAEGASVTASGVFVGGAFSSRPLVSNGEASTSRISDNGRYLVFESGSPALVPDDLNGARDVFLFDRETASVRRVNLTSTGTDANGSSAYSTISGNGQVVALTSTATNLVAGDDSADQDLFFFDLNADTIQRVTVPGRASFGASLSDDGQFATFFASSDQFTPFENIGDIYLYDRTSEALLMIGTDGEEPFISGDGNFIAYTAGSDISLYSRQTGTTEVLSVLGGETPVLNRDGNYLAYVSGNDIVVLDRALGTTDKVSVSANGDDGNDDSFEPSISDDGRFVAFSSLASNLVPGDHNGLEDVFVFDRQTRRIARIGVRSNGVEPTGRSRLPSISGDGKFIAYVTSAAEADDTDSNATDDIYYALNPLFRESDTSLEVTVGVAEIVANVLLGSAPRTGSINGTLFLDEIANGIRDIGEQTLEGWTVFLDLDQNGVLDLSEPKVSTGPDGSYSFTELAAETEYAVRAVSQSGYEQVLPSANTNFHYSVFLPAATTVSNRDFGFVPESTAGQFENGVVNGRLFTDDNVDGVWQAGEAGIAGQTVFIDFNDDGIRQFNEPRTVTDGSGIYEFTGLGNRNHVVRALIDESTRQTTPLGSDFSSTSFSTKTQVGQFTNVQDVIVADINGDGFGDLVSALFDANEISILLGDGNGNFAPSAINVSVSPEGVGPIALAAADLNGQGSLDLIVANNLNGTASVLLDFNGVSFNSITAYDVGETPLDVVIGDFDGAGGLDFVVPNTDTNTLTVMLSDGNGGFTFGASMPSGGLKPTSVAAGYFNNDATLDLAVANFGNHPFGAEFGNVAILFGQGGGSFTAPVPYDVGIGPVGLAAADLDGDNRDDLAVVNFLSNTASLLIGSSSGTFTLAFAELAVGLGPVQVAAADIETDGDTDLLVTNLISQEVSILRSTLSRGVFSFEPAESFGVAESEVSERVSFAVDDLDSSGTQDIVVANSFDDTIEVLLNSLVDGAHRVALTGVETVNGLDFGTQPVLVLPTLDPPADPNPIVEDSLQQTLTLTGIAKGRTAGPPLQFSVESSRPDLIPDAAVSHTDGAPTATLTYTPNHNANGSAVLTVRVIDAGADGQFDPLGTPGTDDAILTRRVTVTVVAVNDPPTFTIPPTVVVNEDAGPQTIANFITGISTGGGTDEQGQTLGDFLITTDSAFFVSPPAIDATGQLTYTAAANVSGTVTVNVSLGDNGGTDNGGTAQATDDFVLTILPVNDAPTFTLGNDITLPADAGPQSRAGFASGFLPGGGIDEASQVVSDFVVTNDSPGLFAELPDIGIDGTLTFTPAIDRSGTANISVRVRDSGGAENGGTDLSSPQTFAITVTPTSDTSRPAPTISIGVPALTNQLNFDVEVDFGEEVTGFTLDDVAISRGTAANLIHLGGGRYRFNYTGTDGQVTFGLPANVAQDLGGNQNVAAVPAVRSLDSQGPLPTIDIAVSSPTNAATISVAVSFGEPVTGFLVSDVIVLGGVAQNLSATDEATGSYSLDVVPADDGPVTVLIPGGAGEDAAGNDSQATFPRTIISDRTMPVPLLSTNEPSRTNHTSFDVFADFGEPVSGLSSTDFVVSGATAADPQDLGNGRYSLNISGASGLVEISMNAAAVQDDAGNSSEASKVLSLTIDTAALVPVLDTSTNSVINTTTFEVDVTFGKQVQNFSLGDITVLNGTPSDLVTIDQANGHFSLTVTAIADGDLNVLIPAGVAEDLAGNPNLASNTIHRVIDRDPPQPTLIANVGSLTNQSTFTLTVDFGELVNDFTLDDVLADGASLSNLQSFGAGVYTLNVAASDGSVGLSLPADVVTDIAGNANAAATSLNLEVDSVRPTPLLSSPAANPTNDSAFTVMIDFGKPVLDFTASDLLIVNGTASELVEVASAVGSYSVVVTPTSDGLLSVLVPAGAAHDAAGNLNLSSTFLNRVVDHNPPVPMLATTVSDRTSQSSFPLTLNFGESIIGFDLLDINVTGATLGNLQTLGSGRFSVDVHATDGLVTLGIDAGVVQDLAGNQNLAAALPTILVDSSQPTPMISAVANQAPGSFAVTITFDEDVTGLAANDFIVTNAMLAQLVGSGNTYTAELTAIDEGELTIFLPEDRVADAVGNRNIDSNTVILQHEIIQPATSIVLEGDGETLDLLAAGVDLTGIQLIDIRGTGNNTLVLAAAKIRSVGRPIDVIADTGDGIVFDAGWEFVAAEFVNGALVRQFANAGALIHLIGPQGLTNPINPFDVNASGNVTSADALIIVNELAVRIFSDGDSDPVGQLRNFSTLDLTEFFFYDVTKDFRLTALDALRVINELARLLIDAEPEFVPISVNYLPRTEQEPAPNDDLLLHPNKQTANSNLAASACQGNVVQKTNFDGGDSTSDNRATSPLSAVLVDAALPTLTDDVL